MRRLLGFLAGSLLSLTAACTMAPGRDLAVADMLPKPEAGRMLETPSYRLFFDVDSATLTAESIATLDQVAAEAAGQPTARIIVAGHADRSGSKRRNKMLSVERAEAVRRYLLRAGVPERSIVSAAYGERRGLVATSDGVIEPQNRRVEIYLRAY